MRSAPRAEPLALFADSGAFDALDDPALAVAEQHGAVILHYDADFEHIAAVTGQAQLWVAPRGSLD